MLDEGLYLFFASEIADQGEFSYPFYTIEYSRRLVQEVENEFAGSRHGGESEQDEDLKRLGRGQFKQCCGNIKTIGFAPVRTFFDLESALADDAQLTDGFREAVTNKGLLFAFENGDAIYFWSGASIKRWFEVRFPREAKKIRYAKPASVLDLLYEFLESVARSPDNFVALKETLTALSQEDRSFVEGILSGKTPKNSKKTQEMSERILRAIKERKV